MRRVFFVLICGILVAAVLGRLGAHAKEVRASGGGYELAVTYDDIARSGLPGNIAIEIRRQGGFGGSVTVSITSKFLDVFDMNGLDPEPVGATTTGEDLIQTFETPTTGDTMEISIDARVQPGIQLHRAEGEVSILENGRPIVSVPVRTFVMP
jgi:hypothetical protein